MTCPPSKTTLRILADEPACKTVVESRCNGPVPGATIDTRGDAVLLSAPLAQPAAVAQEMLSAEEKKSLAAECSRLWGNALRLRAQGQLDEAIAIGQKSHLLSGRIWSKTDSNYASSLNFLELLYRFKGENAKAEAYWTEALDIVSGALGRANEVQPINWESKFRGIVLNHGVQSLRPLLLAVLLGILCARAAADETPVSAVLLRLDGADTDPATIDYAKLPVLKGTHAVINPAEETLKFQLHNYLIHHDGRFWCMWSQGPPVEDEPSQQIRFATSDDGLKWSVPKVLVGPPQDGYAYIARGFWLREGELVALAAHFKGKGAFGVNKELQLLAFGWDKASEAWKPKGRMFDNAINNFPPQKLPTGEWMMTRRDSRFNVSVLIGGQKAFNNWQSLPVVERLKIKGFSPDEPIWWPQPDQTLVALFRDNGGSGRLFRAVSTDHGRTWSLPVLTNFPNSTSKIFSLHTSSGARVLISNANPSLGRRQLHLSISEDGLHFTQMARLDIPSPKPATLQYPHAIEHEGHLLISFSRNKTQSEVFKISLGDIEALRETRQ